MLAVHRIVLTVFLAAAALDLCHGATLFSVFDDSALATEVGAPSRGVFGLTVQSIPSPVNAPGIYLMTVAGIGSAGPSQNAGPVFVSDVFDTSQSVNFNQVSPDWGTGVKLNEDSLFAGSGTSSYFIGPPRFLYTFDFQTNGPAVPFTLDLPPLPGSSLAVSGVYPNDTLYAIFATTNDIYSLRLFGTTAPSTPIVQGFPFASTPVGLAVGPGGLLYTMGSVSVDTGNCQVSQWCVFSFDPATGNLVSDFAVPAALPNGAIAVSSTGQIYLSDGDGGGYAFDLAGNLLDVLSPTSVNPYTLGGRSLIALDPNNDLYTFDTATGLHVFDVSQVGAPEPGSVWLLIAGIALMAGARRVASAK